VGSIVKDIEALISPVTHVSAGLLQSNKALLKETGIVGEKHLIATPSSEVTFIYLFIKRFASVQANNS
jgi:hypothetical protein